MNKMQDVELNMGQGVCLFIRINQESKWRGSQKKKEKEKEIKSYYYGLLGLLMNYSYFTPSK